MRLRHQYLGACDRVISKTGTARVPYRIPEDATLKQCAGYMEDYIIRDRQHFRYDYYMRMLDFGFGRELDVERGGSKPLITTRISLTFRTVHSRPRTSDSQDPADATAGSQGPKAAMGTAATPSEQPQR